MNVSYLVDVTEPRSHMVNVKMSLREFEGETIKFFMPSWSPGSYLMREYARNIRTIKVTSQTGEYLYFEQLEKSLWEIDISKSKLKSACQEITIEYQVYCYDLTVRTCHVDESHAFLHGPGYLMGLFNVEFSPKIEFRFSNLWSKLHTSLKEISEDRKEFIFEAPSYDVLIDAPVEIGCHESDGFMAFGKEHHLIWYGREYDHPNDLKADIKKIVETVGSHFEDIPYESYMFMTHLKPNTYGGLEHLSSTVLQFDGRKFNSREDYVNWLSLVAHEYFHTWNVKRIRPKELGPFDYLKENYTTMHWLTEGLTSFMDELFVLRSDLCSLEEYLNMQTKNLKRYFDTPGKKFHSLEQSSFNAWIKLYKPDENTHNSSISYYLKGGLVFSTLHFEFKKAGKNINDLLAMLWKRYKDNPKEGLETYEVMDMIESIAGKKVRNTFELRISTTEDIDFESYYNEFGMSFEWESESTFDLGIQWEFDANRVIVSKVDLDSIAYKAGINAKDELLAINGLRFLRSDVESLNQMLRSSKSYKFLLSRYGELVEVAVTMNQKKKSLKSINILDEKKALACFKG